LEPAPGERLAPAPERAAEHGAGRGAAPVAGQPMPPGAPPGEPRPERLQHGGRVPRLLRGETTEVGPPEPLAVAGAPRAAGDREVEPGPGLGRGGRRPAGLPDFSLADTREPARHRVARIAAPTPEQLEGGVVGG